jgi:hypothetical protein
MDTHGEIVVGQVLRKIEPHRPQPDHSDIKFRHFALLRAGEAVSPYGGRQPAASQLAGRVALIFRSGRKRPLRGRSFEEEID